MLMSIQQDGASGLARGDAGGGGGGGGGALLLPTVSWAARSGDAGIPPLPPACAAAAWACAAAFGT